jgi:signal transduction histidine kinase
MDAKGRGVRIRYLTEITKNNIDCCKELTELVDEIRHLEGVRSNFMLSESEYLAPVVFDGEVNIAPKIIYCNIGSFVEQQQYLFDMLWNKAETANQRIREIEEGIPVIRTKILESQDDIIREIKNMNNIADHLSICSGLGGMQMSYNFFFDTYRTFVDRFRDNDENKGKEKKESNRLKWIIDINKDNINLVKVFVKLGFQIRHVKNMLPINFGVSDKELALTIEKMEGGKMSSSFLVSNEPLYIDHFNSVFEQLWKTGIDGVQRIEEIETGAGLADIEVISSTLRAQDLYLNILKTASKEILLIFPSTNAFLRQDSMGAIPLAMQAAQERNVRVRILTPTNSLIEQKVRQLKEYCRSSYQLDIRYIAQMSETKATILVADRKDSLVMELKDDAKPVFSQAIGLSTYSNSKAGVLSYVAIFENLWKQSELYDQLMIAHEQVTMHDKMQKEFINVAAHELRTPVQPILGLTDILGSKKGNIEQYQEYISVISRNARRLKDLTEDILDVSRIDGKSLDLRNEVFDLVSTINSLLDDYRKDQAGLANRSEISFESKFSNVLVLGDRQRINQVIHNLLDNALNFTKDGLITISVSKKTQNANEWNITVKDSGKGIDLEMMPRLFTKFATKSQHGIGLGLYISKSIIEAHGGKIWAENNTNEKGANFSFTLPASTN